MGYALPENCPARIGRYEIEAPLAEGATAIVYRARDPAIGRTVAIKHFKTGPDIDQEFVARFQREAQSAGGISHPNIVTVYDVGTAGGAPYITMEYLEEKSLADLMATGSNIPIADVVALGIQMAHALEHAHARGIVHRDIKPDNILLLDGGKTAKLTDFGIARLSDGQDLQRTQAGVVLGTPRYMSPEQALGREVDGRSDLFSLGTILYQLLTGLPAFPSNNLALLMLQIVQENPEPLTTVRPAIPEGLQRIVMKLIAKRPEQRFQTADQVAQALERERAALAAQNEEDSRDRFLPLRAKFAITAGGVLSVLFFLTMAILYNVEAAVLQNEAITSGINLARFFAEHSAVPALGQNWLSLKIFVQGADLGRGFDYLVITDTNGNVQAATDPALIGHRYQTLPAQALLESSNDVSVTSSTLRNGADVFVFNTPIRFQNVEVGRVYLGVSQAGIRRVLRTTFWLMLAVALVGITLVAGLANFFGVLLLRPIRTLRLALEDIGAGDMEVRISQKRRDEIGEIYAAFNCMADRLHERTARAEPTQTAPTYDFSGTPKYAAMSTDATVVARSLSDDGR